MHGTGTVSKAALLVAASAVAMFNGTVPGGALFQPPNRAYVVANDDPGTSEREALPAKAGSRGDLGVRSITPQEVGYVVQHWSIEDGLPLDRLTSLAQTPDGFLWIGTDDQGLSRFDGRNFLNLNPISERGLPGWRVSQLLNDSLGRLWVRNGRDLAIREHGRFRLLTKDIGGPLTEDSLGNIMIQHLDRFELRGFRDGEFELLSAAPPPTPQPRVTSEIQCDLWDRVWGIDASRNQLYEHTTRGPIVHALPEVIGQASAGDESLRRILELRPAMAILDVNMPGLNGLEVAREVLTTLPATKIILLTLHEEENLLDAAIAAGILAYVLKDHAVDELVNAIHAVARGKRFISPSISGHLLRRDQQKRRLRDAKPGLESLPPTERRILQSIAEDNSSKEIADLLGISVRTVETHRQNISNKLNLSGTHSLVKFAFQHKPKL